MRASPGRGWRRVGVVEGVRERIERFGGGEWEEDALKC